MEKYQEAREQALKSVKVADHMLYVTYPVLQDPKLLVSILDNVFLGLTSAMTAVLWHERFLKRIPPFNDTFESKFNLFRAKIAPGYKIAKKYAEFMREIQEIIVTHRKSKVEFRRKDSFIICQDDYSTISVTVPQLKDYVRVTKEFIDVMEIVLKHE